MHRYGNLYSQVCSVDNLLLADKRARMGKKERSEVLEFDKSRTDNLILLRNVLISGRYRTSSYQTFKLYDPKEREIFKLPYYPDRIVHHAITNVLEDILVRSFISTTFNCIRGRGVHKALRAVEEALRWGGE